MRVFYTIVALTTILASCTGGSASPTDNSETAVFKNDDIEIHQIDEHTWHGHGHRVYNESVYIVEGDSVALMIDAGYTIPGLRKIAEDIVKKPTIFVATHVHRDHTGKAVNEWDSVWICEPDTINIARDMSGYKGKIFFLNDGQTFDLGNRLIEVVFTPGHTPGSVTFIDKEAHYGFSGDSFGSTSLLVTTSLSEVIKTCNRMSKYMEQYGIDKLYPGHNPGDNLETLQRVNDLAEISAGILNGDYKPKTSHWQRAIEIVTSIFDKSTVYVVPNTVEDRGLRISYGKRQLK